MKQARVSARTCVLEVYPVSQGARTSVMMRCVVGFVRRRLSHLRESMSQSPRRLHAVQNRPVCVHAAILRQVPPYENAFETSLLSSFRGVHPAQAQSYFTPNQLTQMRSKMLLKLNLGYTAAPVENAYIVNPQLRANSGRGSSPTSPPPAPARTLGAEEHLRAPLPRYALTRITTFTSFC